VSRLEFVLTILLCLIVMLTTGIVLLALGR